MKLTQMVCNISIEESYQQKPGRHHDIWHIDCNNTLQQYFKTEILSGITMVQYHQCVFCLIDVYVATECIQRFGTQCNRQEVLPVLEKTTC